MNAKKNYRSGVCQGIRSHLWSPNINHCVHKACNSTLFWDSLIQSALLYLSFSKDFSISLIYMPGSSTSIFMSGFPTKTSYTILLSLVPFESHTDILFVDLNGLRVFMDE